MGCLERGGIILIHFDDRRPRAANGLLRSASTRDTVSGRSCLRPPPSPGRRCERPSGPRPRMQMSSDGGRSPGRSSAWEHDAQAGPCEPWGIAWSHLPRLRRLFNAARLSWTGVLVTWRRVSWPGLLVGRDQRSFPLSHRGNAVTRDGAIFQGGRRQKEHGEQRPRFCRSPGDTEGGNARDPKGRHTDSVCNGALEGWEIRGRGRGGRAGWHKRQ